jgi:flagellar biogenesis protein FliO
MPLNGLYLIAGVRALIYKLLDLVTNMKKLFLIIAMIIFASWLQSNINRLTDGYNNLESRIAIIEDDLDK